MPRAEEAHGGHAQALPAGPDQLPGLRASPLVQLFCLKIDCGTTKAGGPKGADALFGRGG